MKAIWKILTAELLGFENHSKEKKNQCYNKEHKFVIYIVAVL